MKDEHKSKNKYIKMAFLLSGHFKNGKILEFLNSNTDIDVFVSCWDDFGFRNTNGLEKIEYSEIKKSIKKIKNLKSYEILNNKSFFDENKNSSVNYYNYSSPEIFIKSQLYSINRSLKVFENYKLLNNKNYDVIFKSRFDCNVIKFSMESEKIINDIEKNNIIFVTSNNCHDHPDFPNGCLACNNMYRKGMLKPHIFDHTNIICDFFAYGNFESIKKYCSLYYEYDNLNKKFEQKNYSHIKNHNIPHTKKDNVTYLSHLDSLYYAYCSYPERMLQYYLHDYMIVSSENVITEYHP